MLAHNNIPPQYLAASISSVPSMSTATNSTQADMMLVASSGNFYQVDSTGGSTVWGSGGTATGGADGLNIVSLATATSGGGTGGTTYSASTGTVGFYAGSNMTISQSNNALVFFGPNPAAASVVVSGGASSSQVTGLTFSNSNNVSWTYNGTNIAAIAPILFSDSATSTTATGLVFSNTNGVSLGLSNNTLTASIGSYSLSFADGNGITFGQAVNDSSTTITASHAIRVSAGTLSNNLSALTFANSNGVSFGLSGSVITASAAGGTGGGGGAILVSAGTTSNTSVASLVFSNSNNVSFGLYLSSRITASIPEFSLAFLDTNGITWSRSTAGNTTSIYAVSVAGGVGGGGPAIAAGTQTATAGTVVFQTGVNVSFAMANTSVVRATAWINVSDSATSQSASQVVFSNMNRISFGISSGTGLVATITGSVGSQTNQSLGIYGSSQTTGDASSRTYDARSLTIVGAGGNSVGWTNGSLVISGGAGGGGAAISAAGASASNGTVVFSNSNNVSFGMNGSTVTASLAAFSLSFANSNGVSFGTGGAGSTTTVTASHAINLSAGTTSNNLSALTFANANNATFGLNASTVTVSAPLNVSGGTTSNNVTRLVFADSNGIAFGLNAGTVTVSIVPNSVFEVPTPGASLTTGGVANTVYMQPFNLHGPYSFCRGAMMKVQTTQATSTQSYSWSYSNGAGGGSSGTGQYGMTQTFLLFSRESTGNAANSSNLISFYSTTNTMSFGMYASVSWTNNVSSATMSLSTSNNFGFAWSQINTNGAITTGSTSSSGSTTASSTSTNAATQSSSYGNSFLSAYLSSVRAIPFVLATSLSKGEYWLGYVENTSTGSTNYSLQRPVMANLLPYYCFSSNTYAFIEVGTNTTTPTGTNFTLGLGSANVTSVTSTTFAVSNVSNMFNLRTYYAFYGYSK